MAVIVPTESRRLQCERLKNNMSNAVVLWQNDIDPDITTEYADLTIADFSGYNEVTATFGAVTINGDDNAEMTAGLCQFIHDGGATANDIYGWALIEDNGFIRTIIAVERYGDAPRVMAALDDEIDVTPRFITGVCPP